MARINKSAWSALMEKFGSREAAADFAEAMDSEMGNLPTHADMRLMELRLVKWMIGISITLGTVLVSAFILIARIILASGGG